MAKFWSAFLSPVLICLVGAYAEYMSQDPSGSAVSFFRLFIVGWIILFPIYLFLAAPLSIVVDGMVRFLFHDAPKWVALWMSLVSYLLGSFPVAWLFAWLIGANGTWDAYKWPFMTGAFLYWCIQELLRWVGRRFRRSLISRQSRSPVKKSS